MLKKLECKLEQIDGLNTKLIILVGLPGSGKTKILQELAHKLGIELINISLELGLRLSKIPHEQRGLSVNTELRDVIRMNHNDPLLLDNLELLFEKSLKINPLDVIKRLAQSKRVVATWSGELCDNKLIYGRMPHPEYRSYEVDGIVMLEIPS